MDLNTELEKIASARFFANMGLNDTSMTGVVFINDVREAFVEPSSTESRVLLDKAKWLPTSVTGQDPFYEKRPAPQALIEFRKHINQAVTKATRSLDTSGFSCPPHDFSLAARGAICFAFRQLMTERYFGLGDQWARITALYYAGHWPIGYTKTAIVAI